MRTLDSVGSDDTLLLLLQAARLAAATVHSRWTRALLRSSPGERKSESLYMGERPPRFDRSFPYNEPDEGGDLETKEEPQKVGGI